MSIWPDPSRLAGAGEEGRFDEAEAAAAAEAGSRADSDAGDDAGDAAAHAGTPAQADTLALAISTARGRRPRTLPKQADPDAPLLVVEGLTTHFRLGGEIVHAVDDVSFTLADGEALGIAGESGCGKTTTALSLLRLLPSNAEVVAGTVKLFGIDLRTKSDEAIRRYRWREISIIFQGAMNALNPVQRIGDQIAEPMIERQGLSKGAAATRAGELLELVGIPRARGKAYPHELSGGMRQRAMIAMALACDPAIVIGDEPTTALDVMVQAQILELLEDLREKLGLSLILITHDLSVLAETCDRVMIMYAGRVAEEGPVGTIYRTPRHPYTQMLLAAFPDVHSGRRDLGTIPGSPPDLRTPPPGCRFHPRCPAAMDVCRTEVPVEVRFEDRVRVACHLYPPGSDGVPRPLPVVARAEAVADGLAAGSAARAGPAATTGPATAAAGPAATTAGGPA